MPVLVDGRPAVNRAEAAQRLDRSVEMVRHLASDRHRQDVADRLAARSAGDPEAPAMLDPVQYPIEFEIPGQVGRWVFAYELDSFAAEYLAARSGRPAGIDLWPGPPDELISAKDIYTHPDVGFGREAFNGYVRKSKDRWAVKVDGIVPYPQPEHCKPSSNGVILRWPRYVIWLWWDNRPGSRRGGRSRRTA